jgi:hypothetical protein
MIISKGAIDCIGSLVPLERLKKNLYVSFFFFAGEEIFRSQCDAIQYIKGFK